MSLEAGLYESLITQALKRAIDELGDQVRRERLDPAEAPDRMALHLSRVVERALTGISKENRIDVGMRLIGRLIDELARDIEVDRDRDRPIETAEYLAAILPLNPVGQVREIQQPKTPLLDTTLLANARGEPRLVSQLQSEIVSADRVDVIIAFVRMSGIRPLLDALRDHCTEARVEAPLRVITTVYTGSTERKALDALREIGAEIKVSYDVSSTRLHAKSWIFHRRSGFSTAFVGSSNATHSAQVNGLEWNVRISGARNPDALRKIESLFETYWNSSDFSSYRADEFDSRKTAIRQSGGNAIMPPTELWLQPFQERLLERIEVSRKRGRHRNLLVSATGTGKTVIAAIDFARMRAKDPNLRLLFVAHRSEILSQAMSTYRIALRDMAFGEMWVQGRQPVKFNHVFASIQTLTAHGIDRIESDRFDVVVVDEFHHARAKTYEHLLSHLAPKELLGLTATPERSDGLSVLDWFEDGITAELRLWDAIDQGRLVPFVYWGVSDGLDLSRLPWKRGKGYDLKETSKLYTSDDAWVRRVVHAVHEHVDDVDQMRALGFCVSVEHAEYMAKKFNEHGIVSVAITGETNSATREESIGELRAGGISVIFSVDVFNEGLDVRSVNTVLFLRPSDSATLFVQQLGRGLRKEEGKAACTVLDFVGRHRSEFRFSNRLGALIGGSRRSIEHQIKEGFPYLPTGCHLDLDSVAREEVLRNLRESVPERWNAKIRVLSQMRTAGSKISLGSFLDEAGIELSELYRNNHSWSDLLEQSGCEVSESGRFEAVLRRAIGRLLHIDDDERLSFYLQWLQGPGNMTDLTVRQGRMVRMLVGSLFSSSDDIPSVSKACEMIWDHPQIMSELLEVFRYKLEKLDRLHFALETHQDAPLQVHARYTRVEILAALAVGDESSARVPPWREGVRWIPDQRTDVFALTLDKSSGGFSPTTMYRDYAISRDRMHWETQSQTSETSETGQRYIKHEEIGSCVLLFARENADSKHFWFLGPATYIGHEGERPMGITWSLRYQLSGDMYSSFVAAVA